VHNFTGGPGSKRGFKPPNLPMASPLNADVNEMKQGGDCKDRTFMMMHKVKIVGLMLLSTCCKLLKV